MTELQHAVIGGAILMTLWFVWLRRYFVTEKDVRLWDQIIRDWRSKD